MGSKIRNVHDEEESVCVFCRLEISRSLISNSKWVDLSGGRTCTQVPHEYIEQHHRSKDEIAGS